MKNLVPRAFCAAVLAVGLVGGPAAADSRASTVSASRPSVAGFVTPMEPAHWMLTVVFEVPTITCTSGENSEAFIGAAVYATDMGALPFAGVRLACIDGSATYEGWMGYTRGAPIWPVSPGDRMRARVAPKANLGLIDHTTSDNAVSGFPAEGHWTIASAGVYAGAGPVTDFPATTFLHLSLDRTRVTGNAIQRSKLRRDGIVLVTTSALSQHANFTVRWRHRSGHL